MAPGRPSTSRPRAGEKFEETGSPASRPSADAPEPLADADVPGEGADPARELDEVAVLLGVAGDRVDEGADDLAADRVRALVVVAVLRRVAQHGAQPLVAREVRVQRGAELGHGRAALLEDDRLDRRQRVDGVGGATRPAGRRCGSARRRPSCRGAPRWCRRSARSAAARARWCCGRRCARPRSRPVRPTIRSSSRQEGAPDIVVARERAGVARVEALLAAVQAGAPAVQGPLQAEHQAEALEAEVRPPGDDDLPAAVVGVVARVRGGECRCAPAPARSPRR